MTFSSSTQLRRHLAALPLFTLLGCANDFRAGGSAVLPSSQKPTVFIEQNEVPVRTAVETLDQVSMAFGGRTYTVISAPFGAEYLLAQDQDGSYATAVTSSYNISQYELNGTLRRRIVRDLPGEPLTPEEFAFARERMDVYERATRSAIQQGASITGDLQIPEVKTPIRRIWFDEESRLWVELGARTPEGLAQADVYSSDGTLNFRAHWPQNIDLAPHTTPQASGGNGASRRLVAWGVRTGQLDEHWLVRLRFE